MNDLYYFLMEFSKRDGILVRCVDIFQANVIQQENFIWFFVRFVTWTSKP